MSSTLREKNDVKVFILYLMMNISYPLDYTTINEIAVQDGIVSNFDFNDCFAELLETGNIEERQENGVTLYNITRQGITVAETLEGNLHQMIRDKSLRSALRLLSFKKRGSDIVCYSEPMEDGKHVLTCRVIEYGNEVMSVRLIADNTVELEKMKNNFIDRPETCYRGILALLSGEVNYLLD